MNEKTKTNSRMAGAGYLAAFWIWTIMILTVDVSSIGPEGTRVGFALLNGWFHRFTGVHMGLYTVTDWLGLVPIGICMGFGILGLVQLIRRRSLLRVDKDLILLGIYYMAVIGCYLLFEMLPVNFRPVLINGYLEASYPSSTTLLVLSVMPTLEYQTERRLEDPLRKKRIILASRCFAAFMVMGRLAAGVHWLTDIMGAVLLSRGLFLLYREIADGTEKGRIVPVQEKKDGIS